MYKIQRHHLPFMHFWGEGKGSKGQWYFDHSVVCLFAFLTPDSLFFPLSLWIDKPSAPMTVQSRVSSTAALRFPQMLLSACHPESQRRVLQYCSQCVSVCVWLCTDPTVVLHVVTHSVAVGWWIGRALWRHRAGPNTGQILPWGTTLFTHKITHTHVQKSCTLFFPARYHNIIPLFH